MKYDVKTTDKIGLGKLEPKKIEDIYFKYSYQQTLQKYKEYFLKDLNHVTFSTVTATSDDSLAMIHDASIPPGFAGQIEKFRPLPERIGFAGISEIHQLAGTP